MNINMSKEKLMAIIIIVMFLAGIGLLFAGKAIGKQQTKYLCEYKEFVEEQKTGLGIYSQWIILNDSILENEQQT